MATGKQKKKKDASQIPIIDFWMELLIIFLNSENFFWMKFFCLYPLVLIWALIVGTCGTVDRAQDSWTKCCGFESRYHQRVVCSRPLPQLPLSTQVLNGELLEYGTLVCFNPQEFSRSSEIGPWYLIGLIIPLVIFWR